MSKLTNLFHFTSAEFILCQFHLNTMGGKRVLLLKYAVGTSSRTAMGVLLKKAVFQPSFQTF